MKLAIFGGTGQTGQHLVKAALDAGHTVAVLARTPSKLNTQHDNLMVIEGDVLDADKVDAVIAGANAVLSALGPPNNKPDFVISRGMDHILTAMDAHNVRRIILSTGAGNRDPLDNPKLIDRVAGFMIRLISKNVVADMEAATQKVRATDLDWTIVRAPRLTNQPAKGSLKVGYVGDISPQLSREDFAAFMLQQLDDTTHTQKAPAISN